MAQAFEFFVPGKPATKGSFKAFVHRKGKKAGQAFVVNSDTNCKDWQNRVALAAQQAGVNRYWEDAVGLEVTFYLMRPKDHYGTGKNAAQLKKSAPGEGQHIKKPDFDKMIRAVADGLTHIVYRDDAQIVHCVINKRYGSEIGVKIRVTLYEAHEDYENCEVITC